MSRDVLERVDLANVKSQVKQGDDDRLLDRVRTVLEFFGLCFLLVLLADCEKAGVTSKPSPPAPSPSVSRQKLSGAPGFEAGPARFDVCRLLRKEEVQAIAGSTITQSSGSGRSNRGLRISQCIYLASQPSQSVSLVVTQTESSANQERTAKDFWQERFGRYQEHREGKREEVQVEEKEEEEASRAEEAKEEEREGRPPRKVDGVGEEAFWTAGSLYVLDNGAFVRLSIGGAAAEETKLEQSKALAAIVLKRL